MPTECFGGLLQCDEILLADGFAEGFGFLLEVGVPVFGLVDAAGFLSQGVACHGIGAGADRGKIREDKAGYSAPLERYRGRSPRITVDTRLASRWRATRLTV